MNIHIEFLIFGNLNINRRKIMPGAWAEVYGLQAYVINDARGGNLS